MSNFKHVWPLTLRHPRKPPKSESAGHAKAAWWEQHCLTCCNQKCGTKDQCKGVTKTQKPLSHCPKCGGAFS